ncbi:CDP-alcohol phosphatidyltransferase family protein [Streptomyces uncialis]|uniref:CDP-alcohol phosphatidyltransferase family protein n=1 Tax=Streptomyces uncialis TaxID=1048205 RepID=UPI003667B894
MALNQASGEDGTRLARHDIAAGAVAQVLLLALLAGTVGLGPAGRLTGLVFAVGTWVLLTRALRRARPGPFGPANRVTLARATLVGAVTALVADSLDGPPRVTPLAALAGVALVLDAVDGLVARRTGTVSELGARFDMEVDAFLILVLSVYVSARLGPWVLLIGLMRYGFVAAARVLPWLNAPLTPSTARKAVAAFQGVALLAAATYLPRPLALPVILLALTTLTWSFGRDIIALFRTRTRTRTLRDPTPRESATVG